MFQSFKVSKDNMKLRTPDPISQYFDTFETLKL